MQKPRQQKVNFFIEKVKIELKESIKKKSNNSSKDSETMLREGEVNQRRKCIQSCQITPSQSPPVQRRKISRRSFYQLYEEEMIKRNQKRKRIVSMQSSQLKLSLNSMPQESQQSAQRTPKLKLSLLEIRYIRSKQHTPSKKSKANKSSYQKPSSPKQIMPTSVSSQITGIKKQLNSKVVYYQTSKVSQGKFDKSFFKPASNFRRRFSKYESNKSSKKQLHSGLHRVSKLQKTSIGPWHIIEEHDIEI